MRDLEIIIPAAGIGKRLRPHTHSMPKGLIHVAGKPILGHILDEVESLSPARVILVVGHKAQMLEDYVRSRGKKFYHFVQQPEAKGIGHAVWLASRKLAGGPLLIVLGDTIFRTDLASVIKRGKNSIAVKSVPDPSRFGVVELERGRIARITEKPKRPKSKLAIVGIYYFKDSRILMEELAGLVSSGKTTKGEFQFTDGLSGMVRRGVRLETFSVSGWYDCGTVAATLDANASLLKLSGGNGRRFKDSVIVRPSYVDRTATVLRSVIGPYASIAPGATVADSIVRDSIIETGARVENAILDRSLIGRSAYVREAARSLNVSELSEVSHT